MINLLINDEYIDIKQLYSHYIIDNLDIKNSKDYNLIFENSFKKFVIDKIKVYNSEKIYPNVQSYCLSYTLLKILKEISKIEFNNKYFKYITIKTNQKDFKSLIVGMFIFLIIYYLYEESPDEYTNILNDILTFLQNQNLINNEYIDLINSFSHFITEYKYFNSEDINENIKRINKILNLINTDND